MAKRATKDGGSATEAELFRMSTRDVTPLARPGKVVHARPRPQPLALQRLNDEREALRESLEWDGDVETGEELSFARDGIGAPTLRKLRRGHWVIQDELDLHGLIVPDARELLAEFLVLCVRRGLRCVRIVHGKGLRSRGGQPVLKHKVAKWLMQRDDVLAYSQARPTDGGGGAVVVLLKSGSRP